MQVVVSNKQLSGLGEVVCRRSFKRYQVWRFSPAPSQKLGLESPPFIIHKGTAIRKTQAYSYYELACNMRPECYASVVKFVVWSCLEATSWHILGHTIRSPTLTVNDSLPQTIGPMYLIVNSCQANRLCLSNDSSTRWRVIGSFLPCVVPEYVLYASNLWIHATFRMK
jgi:hypothetical protein